MGFGPLGNPTQKQHPCQQEILPQDRWRKVLLSDTLPYVDLCGHITEYVGVYKYVYLCMYIYIYTYT